MLRCAVLLLAFGLASSVSVRVLDAPGNVERPGSPHPDEDGITVEDVVNVHKRAILIVMSSADQAIRRQTIRDTWVQPLNRSSEYALPKEDRRSYSVWFSVPSVKDDDALMDKVRQEGAASGDLLVLETHSDAKAPDELTKVGAILRWLRVAYYQRFDFVLITTDDSFVSLYNLNDFCKANENSPFLYKGYVNSFAPNHDTNAVNKYYAPFVQEGTIVLGYEAAELAARELGLLKHLGRFDATFGNFFMSFDVVKPEHDGRFIVDIEHVYSPIATPIVVKGVSLEMMVFLSRAICDASGCRTPTLPASTPELRSTYVYVDPHPTTEEPLCNEVNAVKCSIKALAAAEIDHSKQ